jgi:hypothetical protein
LVRLKLMHAVWVKYTAGNMSSIMKYGVQDVANFYDICALK